MVAIFLDMLFYPLLEQLLWWISRSLYCAGPQGRCYQQGVQGHVEEEGGEGDGLDCQLFPGEAVHAEGVGGAGAFGHLGEVNMVEQNMY